VLLLLVAAAGQAPADERPAHPAAASLFSYEVPGIGPSRYYDHSLEAGDPVAMSSGAFHFALPLASLGGDVPLAAVLHYRSDLQHAGNGHLLRLPTTFWLEPFATLNVDLAYGDSTWATAQVRAGDWVSFKKVAGAWALAGASESYPQGQVSNNGSPVRFVLVTTAQHAWLMDPVLERVYLFEKSSVVVNGSRRLTHVLDRNGNALRFVYPSAGSNDPVRIEDGRGRGLDLAYQTFSARPLLRSLTDQCGRSIVFTHEPSTPDNAPRDTTLRSVTDAGGGVTVFAYAGADLIASLTTPAGRVPSTQTYASVALAGTFASRVVSQSEAGAVTSFTYDPASYYVTATYPDGTSDRFRHYSNRSLPAELTDAAGSTAVFQKNDREQITYVKDRENRTTFWTYHPDSGKLATVRNARVHFTTFTYTPRTQTFANPLLPAEQVEFTFHDLARIDYPGGAFETFSYDGRGNVLARTDRGGGVWTYTYDAAGRVLTESNPTGGVRTNVFNADGTLAATHDSDTGLTSFAYDPCKRLARVDRPDGSFETFLYDARDRVTQHVDGRGTTTTVQYDADGNPTRVVRADGTPASQETLRSYDALGRLQESTGPLGGVTSFAYTYWGGVARVTRPGGGAVDVLHDPRRWINGVRDELDNLLAISRNREGVTTGATSPLGRTVALGTDPLGAVVSVTDPRGNTLTLARDPLGRIVRITDRAGRESTIVRDGEGRVTSITTPLTGTVTYTRNALGLVTRITDQRGSHWEFAYTPAGRRTGATDPLGRTAAYAWDSSGRLAQVTHPDGVVETRTWDAAGNLVERAFTGGLVLGFTYDALGRMTASASSPVTVTWDARDRVTATTMAGATVAAAWDGADRLATLDIAGQATVSYAHDARGLVTAVSDSASGAWAHLTWDADRLLAAIERSNGVTTEIERNANGRITRIRHGGLGQLDFTFAADDAITAVAEALPLDVAAFLSPEIEGFEYDAANQTAAAGFSHDARGRRKADPRRTYDWDAADRLVRVTHDGAAADCEYTASGELVRRTVGGVVIDYVRSYSLPGRPVVAEKRNGAWYRYFVHTPQGRLLWAVSAAAPAAPSFYHFNHLGTTLFLTDASGAVTDSYGYTPYGRLIRHEGASDQPFAFVGELGVLLEGTSGLYHMRARVYDSRTARFVSRDPRWPDLDDPRALNPYQYGAQNPLGLIDPSGESYYVDQDGRPLPPDWRPESRPVTAGQIYGEIGDDGRVTWFISFVSERGTLNWRRARFSRPPSGEGDPAGVPTPMLAKALELQKRPAPPRPPVEGLTDMERYALRDWASWGSDINCDCDMTRASLLGRRGHRQPAMLLGVTLAALAAGYVLARRRLARPPRGE
jgi:RHS repeat-associated protein